MVMTAYVTIDMNGERPYTRIGEAVLMRADNEAAVIRVKICRGGGKKQARVGALIKMMRALEAKGRWCFQAKHARAVDNGLANGLTRWRGGQILEKMNAECPGIAWQVKELGTGEQPMCSEILREGTHLEELQLRLGKTYEANWKMWVSWRSFIWKESCLQKDMGEMELVRELVEFMGYCWAGKRNKESTIVGNLVAINFYNEQLLGLSVPMITR